MDRNPQAEQMASDAMVRTLTAQATALWPLEAPLFDRYRVPDDGRLLDLGCGIGEVTLRLADRFPMAEIRGVDIHEPHLVRARARAADRPSVRFEIDDAFELSSPDAHFDGVVCRHVVQSLPRPELALAEIHRVVKPGGWVHILAEDYGMIHFAGTRLDSDRFWRDGPGAFAAKIDNDLQIGRKLGRLLDRLGFEQIRVDYLAADTQRVDRAVLAAIWEAWAEGYTAPIAEHTALTLAEVEAYWADMIHTIRDPGGYALWQVPIWAAQRGR